MNGWKRGFMNGILQSVSNRVVKIQFFLSLDLVGEHMVKSLLKHEFTFRSLHSQQPQSEVSVTRPSHPNSPPIILPTPRSHHLPITRSSTSPLVLQSPSHSPPHSPLSISPCLLLNAPYLVLGPSTITFESPNPLQRTNQALERRYPVRKQASFLWDK